MASVPDARTDAAAPAAGAATPTVGAATALVATTAPATESARASRWLALRRRVWPWLRTAHAWTGLAACALTFVLGLSGALLVFEEPWLRATVPGANATPVTDPERLAAAAVAAERAFGPDAPRSVVFGSARFGLHEVALRDGGGAWLHPDTLAVVAQWERHGRFWDWLFALHHELLLGRLGAQVAGWVGIAALALVFSGVAYWAKLGFRGACAWPRSASARELDAAHRTWGAVAAVPLVVLLATGAGLALPEVAKPVLAAATASSVAEPPAPRVPTTRANATGKAADPLAWDRALVAAQAAFPDATPRIAVWPRDGAAPLVRLRRPAEWHANGRTSVWFEPATGAVLASRDALAASPALRAFAAFWPLHASRVGGWAWQLVAAAAGLALAALSVAGAAAYLGRLRRR